MVANREEGLIASLAHLSGVTDRCLQEKHHLFYTTSERFVADSQRKHLLDCEFLSNIDVLFGPVDLSLLEARATLQRNIPYLLWPLGITGRGLFTYREAWKLIKRSDLLVGTCRAELAVLNQFFPNARTALVYLPADTDVFRPMAESERQKVREQLSILPTDPVIIYAGRLTLEKNVHTVLKIFSVLREFHTSAHLIVVGPAEDVPFWELGAYSIHIERTLKRLIDHYGIPGQCIHFIDRCGQSRLRELYAAADVLINMTLHHDENFGFAQVEAMACGTPVVGTGWGGLLDTVGHDGVSYRAAVRLTPNGAKIDWLDAAAHISKILTQADDVPSQRKLIRDYAKRCFSVPVYRRALDRLLTMAGNDEGEREPLQVSAFANEYWELCCASGAPRHRFGSTSFALYQGVISHYAGTTDQADALELADFDELRFFSYAPIELRDAGWLYVEDLIFPAAIRIPDPYISFAQSLLGAFMQKPFLSGREIREIGKSDDITVLVAVAWMHAEGLLGAGRPADEGWMDCIHNAKPNIPALKLDRVPLSADIAVLGN